MAGDRAVRPRRVPLPHRAELERSFGTSLAGVRAYTGAGQALDRLGARAAATRDVVAFAESAPDLEVTAHEVAHVLQHRGGAAGDVATAEQDADAAADAVLRGEPASVGAAAGAEVQLWPGDKKRKAKKAAKLAAATPAPQAAFHLGGPRAGWGLGDEDVDTVDAGPGGSLNRVDKITYKHGIGTGGERLGYFKPMGKDYDKNQVKQAIATTRLNTMLGFNQLPTEYAATHRGEAGTVSPSAKGTPVYQGIYDKEIDTQGEDPAAYVARNPTRKGVVGGKVLAYDGHERVFGHDYRDPRIQKGLADLQLFDAITGQDDRHGGNILIDDETGTVTGIDNDRLQPHWDVAEPFKHYRGLPSQVDEGTAARILAADADELLDSLQREMRYAGAGQVLKKTEDHWRRRLKVVQDHVRALQDDGKLVAAGGWGPETFAAAMAEDKFQEKPTSYAEERSYVRKWQDMQDEAARGLNGNVAEPMYQSPAKRAAAARAAVPPLKGIPQRPALARARTAVPPLQGIPQRPALPPARARPMRKRALTPISGPSILMAAPADASDMPAAPAIDVPVPPTQRKRRLARRLPAQLSASPFA